MTEAPGAEPEPRAGLHPPEMSTGIVPANPALVLGRSHGTIAPHDFIFTFVSHSDITARLYPSGQQIAANPQNWERRGSGEHPGSPS